MITRFKIYESKDSVKGINVGDYVIMSCGYLVGASDSQKIKMKEFLDNNIGEVINVNPVHINLTVKYHDIPFQISWLFSNNSYIFKPSQIVEIAPTVEDLKMKLQASKFNL